MVFITEFILKDTNYALSIVKSSRIFSRRKENWEKVPS
ncbi:hypothetical protein LEP1GSC103_3029 [Leptospira borgpetersenii serovar Javanica str. UI 09931]|uniref:Uncharacterized protein n=4 Tax=Leptospira borgpetersenii TaxID=174 RepID=A0A0S2IR91_LEPBO|nr:hypothetical protein LBBP_01903 [Leptospira borgpetersenii serovar Ballum]EKP12692.1 hypothetical protein LEP1GSC128_3029 [Leptospira borgpetersenii str. 200801926]EKQ91958.1 hypothetical protein LEP1GSC101_3367 [Leptospira borgpetersenii str. UI 09149]EKR01966.1 hypothetical protein LEP1GSC121_3989 [Leptospira borgpetersenii serovar Castellonis str. 200801910]EMN12663.1 hypothetical protein LEP1GSC055_2473 [Leptospira borgpetersenii str. Brem 307]EMN18656.1 hypothetical protein LEP1GSC056_